MSSYEDIKKRWAESDKQENKKQTGFMDFLVPKRKQEIKEGVEIKISEKAKELIQQKAEELSISEYELVNMIIYNYFFNK